MDKDESSKEESKGKQQECEENDDEESKTQQQQRPENTCTICIESISRASRATINCCEHEFCLDCIKEWSKIKNECPLCKKIFNQIKFRLPGTDLKSNDPTNFDTIEVENVEEEDPLDSIQ